MQKQNLKRAHDELFRRDPDERFSSLSDLSNFCRQRRAESQDRWIAPSQLHTHSTGKLLLEAGAESHLEMNDWSFGQLCKLAGVGKETINRLSPETASRAFAETLPRGTKPLQVFTQGNQVRSIHGTSYTRLHDVELIHTLQEFAVDFQPPQTGMNGATGLYVGEQDLFCFLIDPTGWTEIDGEAFAPGFFVWNSEVGRRSLGIQSFWFQAVCQNHIVWDAVEVQEYSRKHTGKIHDSLNEVRRIIEELVSKRDARRDGFVKVIRQAMQQKLGDDADESLKALLKHGIPRHLAKDALALATQQGKFTIFALVDALTRLAGEVTFAGDRNELDAKAATLLALAV